MTNRDTILSDAQLAKLNLLVSRAYRRCYHDYRKMTPELAIIIIDWTMDTLEGREAYAHAAKVVTGEEKEGPWS